MSDPGAAPPPAGAPHRTTPWPVVVAAAALLLGRAAHLWNPYLVVDDAFISFRYARNLAEGHGLVFNAGERVEGYTNFLWTLLLAGGAALGHDLPRLSMALAAVAGVAAVVVLARLAHATLAESPDVAALPPLLFAALGSQPRFVVSGMETLLFAALLLLALERLLVARRPGAAGVAFALAAMTRPEGGLYWLVSLPFAGAAYVGAGEEPPRRRRARAAAERAPRDPRLRCAAAFLALYLPYFLWRWGYYGWLLPNTFYVKASGFSWDRPARGAAQLLELADRWNAWPLPLLAVGSLVVPAGASAMGAGGRPGLRALCWTWIAVTVAYFLWVGGDFLPFFGPRFLVPALPPLLLLAAQGLAGLTQALGRRLGAGLRRVAVAGLVVAALWLSWPERLGRLPGLALEMEAWTRLGRWIRDNTPEEAVVATGGAGIVPYVSRRPTIDMFGLTDEHIAHLPPQTTGYRAVAHEKYAPHYVLDRRPDLLLAGLKRDGSPRTAGLAGAAVRLRACYAPFLLVKVRGERPPEDGWLLFTNRPTPALHDAGYRTAAFRRRRGDSAADCRRLERRRREALARRQGPANEEPRP